ncbi:MAG TPA: proteasome activator [Actinomycetota bacterium]
MDPNQPPQEPRLRPEVPGVPAQPDHEPGQEGQQESITQPAKLLRIASMVRELLEETRAASLDEPGRIRLRDIYDRSVGELKEVLSPDLQEELAMLAPPMEGVPTEAEIRVAQAQLVGWLEGLFHGIQAALFAQQAAARAQFEEIRRRGLPSGQPEQVPPAGPGQYL